MHDPAEIGYIYIEDGFMVHHEYKTLTNQITMYSW